MGAMAKSVGWRQKLLNAERVLKEAWDSIKPTPELTHSYFMPLQTE